MIHKHSRCFDTDCKDATVKSVCARVKMNSPYSNVKGRGATSVIHINSTLNGKLHAWSLLSGASRIVSFYLWAMKISHTLVRWWIESFASNHYHISDQREYQHTNGDKVVTYAAIRLNDRSLCCFVNEADTYTMLQIVFFIINRGKPLTPLLSSFVLGVCEQ